MHHPQPEATHAPHSRCFAHVTARGGEPVASPGGSPQTGSPGLAPPLHCDTVAGLMPQPRRA